MDVGTIVGCGCLFVTIILKLPENSSALALCREIDVAWSRRVVESFSFRKRNKFYKALSALFRKYLNGTLEVKYSRRLIRFLASNISYSIVQIPSLNDV